MIDSQYFKKLLDFVYSAHQENPRQGASTTRQQGTVPFVVHPLWCGLLLLNDATVDQAERELGFQALLFHDVLEDTKLRLPDFIDPMVPPLVADMTYTSWDQEKNEVPTKSIFVQFLKVIDKAATIYDSSHTFDGTTKGREWKQFSLLLLANTRSTYGETHVYQLMEKIITDWKPT